MKSLSKPSQWLLTWSVAWLIGLSVQAYPPAPHHLFYGTVRDELGNPINVESSEVILDATSGTRVKSKLVPDLERGVNYRLSVPMDAGITADLYKPTAVRPALPFRIWVRIGQTVYLPIEMKGDYAHMGQPGQRTRLDLTLGEDSDGDGLPDAWERALIVLSDGTKTLSDIRPGDDFDGDGISNLNEYIAGTYAFDQTDGFALKMVRKDGDSPVVEFLAIRGRTYTVQGSADFGHWEPVQFRTDSSGSPIPGLSYYYATDVRKVQASLLLQPDQQRWRFFRLMVQ